MWIRVAILLMLLTGPQICAAGAWLRDKGSLFMSVTSAFRHTDGGGVNESSAFAEYGLTPKITIGFDYNQLSGPAISSGHAMAFVRLPLPFKPGKSNLAVETAVGGHHWFGIWQPMYKATLSYGRGIKTKNGYGWLAVDAAYEHRLNGMVKLDATLGLPGKGRLAPILQLETAKASDLPLFWAVIPGLRWDTKKAGTWVVGLETRQTVERVHGIKFGLWREF